MNSIIIVESGQKFREFLVDFFDKHEFEAKGCASYSEALSLLQNKRFDIAVINYFIGVERADELCRFIEYRYHDETALIIISDTQSAEIERSIRSHSPAVYFVKPFTIDNLYAVALKALEVRDKRRLTIQHVKSVH